MKIENYGDMLAKVTGKKLISYNEFGSYQGDWIATLEDGENIELWKGYYGSCPGCDWLEEEKHWDTSEVPDEKAKDFFKEDRPFAVIPKETINRVDLETFIEMLPANTRADIYDFEPEKLFKGIKSNINK